MSLDMLRKNIEDTDMAILNLLRRRLELAKEVGIFKIENGERVRNQVVEEIVINRFRDYASKNGMNPDYAEEICRILMKESIELQESLSK